MATPPNISLSRLGRVNQAGSTDALFLKQFGGEILTEFEQNMPPHPKFTAADRTAMIQRD